MIVLDLDDTLYLERNYALSGFRHVGELIERERAIVGFGEACYHRFEAGERGTIFNSAADDVGMELTDEALQTLVGWYRSHTPQIELCSDAAAFLEQNPRQLGLITDGPAVSQWAKIEALDIRSKFDRICVTGDWPPGFGKPHERAFIEMEETSEEQPMCYVADNPAKDFVTPNRRGWRTVQIRRQGAIHDPEPPSPEFAAQAVIKTLDELDAALAQGPEGRSE